MRLPFDEITFAGVSATGDEARGIRRKLNKAHSVGSTYLHEWHDSLKGLPPDVRVLCIGMDVAGFPGNLREDFTRRGIDYFGSVVSVDFDPVRIQRLKHVFEDDNRFTFLLDGPASLQFASGFAPHGSELVPAASFDIAICTYCLHDGDVTHPTQALFGLARALKPDGLCLVATHARSSFAELLSYYRRACVAEGLILQSKAPFEHFDNFAQEDAQELLLKCFVNVTFQAEDTSLRFNGNDPDALDRFMLYSDYFPYPGLGIETVNEPKRIAVRNHICKMAADELSRQGCLVISKPSGVFLCRKPIRR